jgi:hypothetical protein
MLCFLRTCKRNRALPYIDNNIEDLQKAAIIRHKNFIGRQQPLLLAQKNKTTNNNILYYQ